MNIKKNFLSRIARRKAAEAEPEDGHGIPPPAAIEPFVPDATGISEEKGFCSHRELEPIASGEPAPTGSANGADPVDGGDAPAPEALVEPVTDESPDAPEPPRGAAPYEEYGIDLEPLSETEPSRGDEVAEASASQAGMAQQTGPDTHRRKRSGKPRDWLEHQAGTVDRFKRSEKIEAERPNDA